MLLQPPPAVGLLDGAPVTGGAPTGLAEGETGPAAPAQALLAVK